MKKLLVALGLGAILLSGCSSVSASHPGDVVLKNGNNIGQTHVLQIVTPRGLVTCVVVPGYAEYVDGISCDWDHMVTP